MDTLLRTRWILFMMRETVVAVIRVRLEEEEEKWKWRRGRSRKGWPI